ncbi:MAG: hypothetical protein JKY80_02040, partial [Mariprofundaceae bacterium]|nr:hypothetical protein [Mariprofundaceae bacterium]
AANAANAAAYDYTNAIKSLKNTADEYLALLETSKKMTHAEIEEELGYKFTMCEMENECE